MPENSHVSQHIYLRLAQTLRTHRARGSLAAIALFCIAVATTTPALAQERGRCGRNITNPVTLSANQWTMVGVPCIPSASNNTILGFFGASLGAADYGVTWIAWKRVYDDAQCVVPSGPLDCYVKLTTNSPVAVGDAFWIYTTNQATLSFPSSSARNVALTSEFTATLSTDNNSRYYMFANPFNRTLSWADFLFEAPFAGAPAQVDTATAVGFDIISKNVHYWNGNTYFTQDLNTPVAGFIPQGAAWLEFKKPLPLVTGPVKVITPNPNPPNP